MDSRRLLLALALLATLPRVAAAQQRSLVIERYATELHVQKNGDTEVTERITARFQGSWNGLYRDLSLEHVTGQNRREKLKVDLISITDDQGESLRFERSSQGAWTRRFKIWVPGAHDATRTVVIRYVVHNAIRFFDEQSNVGPLDEVYWNATGNSWEIPIEHATAEVVLPETGKPLQFAAYTGTTGSKEHAVETVQNGGTVDFTATRPFAAGEGMTVAVGWAPGLVARPVPPPAIVAWAGQALPLALPIGIFALAFGAWRKTGKDPEARAITVQYSPPPQLTPSEIGTLIDHKAEPHDITATLVDLAVRGYIHIEKRKDKKLLGLMSSTEYVFHLKKPHDQWRDLTEHEQYYLDGMFKYADASSAVGGLMRMFGGRSEPEPLSEQAAGPGQTFGSVELSSLRNRFYKDLRLVRSSLYAQLISKGYYQKNPESVKTGWIAGAVALGAIGFVAVRGVAQTGFMNLDPTMLGVATAVSAVMLLVFAQIMPARTERGARARENALGFKEFLGRVEEDRFRRMITSPEMFERYLPYAMVFKVEQRWAKAFEDMYTQPPQWYSGYDGGAFRASAFTHDMASLSTAASSTMSSSPSGSGGGGSSGGGSGGGGGGGF